MTIMCKNGEPFSEEMQKNASLLYVETPGGNIIVINDALMNAQTMLISKDDFVFIKELHSKGGDIVELEFNSKLVSGEFKDIPSKLGIKAVLQLVEDPFNDEHVGTMMFIDKNIETRYALVAEREDGKSVRHFLVNAFDLTARAITDDIKDKLYRIVIEHDTDVPFEFYDVFKAIALDTGPVRCVKDDDKQKED